MRRFSGSKLKKARESIGWSLSDLHYHLTKQGYRLSLQAIRYWESGQRSPSSNALAALSKVLQRQIEYFFVSSNRRVPVNPGPSQIPTLRLEL